MPGSIHVRERTIPLWVKALLLFVSLVLAAEVGNLLSVQKTFATFWPPAGLFLAILLISDRKDWPVLILSAVAANLTCDLMNDRALLMTLGFSTANVLEAVTGATLVGWLIGHRPKLDSLRQVLVFTTIGAMLAPVVGATAGTAVVVLGVPGANWWTTWPTWWIGDVLGIVLVGSVVLAGIGWWDDYRETGRGGLRRRLVPIAYTAVVAVPFALLANVVFGSTGGVTSWKFLTTPGYLIAGIVGGPFGGSAGLLVIALGAIAGMVRGVRSSGLASSDVASSVFQAQAFFVVGGIATLALAGVIAENRKNAASAEAAAAQFRQLFDTMREGVAYCRMIYDDQGQPADWIYLQVNEAFGALTGIHDVVGRHIWEVLPGLDDTNPELFDIYGAVARTGTPALFESTVVPLARVLRISVTSPAQGEFVAVFEDVSERVTQENALAESNKRLAKMVYDVAEAMGSVVEARDPYTQGHEVRVAALARRIAEEMGLSEDERDEIGMAGLLHDIGKLRVPAEILTKPGVLSAAEFALIKEHPAQGHEILGHIDFGWPVADVVEAMASHRPYRPAVGLQEAIDEIATHPERYDADAVAACIRLHERGETGL